MKPRELRAHLKKHLAPVYILSGPEAFLREEAEHAVRARAGLRPQKPGQLPAEAGQCEEIILWASEGTSLPGAIEEALTRPLFAPSKFVVLREADQELKRDSGALRSYLRSPAPFSTPVLECTGERTGSYKGAVTVECRRLFETEYGRPGISAASPLGKWLRARAARAGVELSSEAIVGLIEALGADLGQLASALELAAANLKGRRAGLAEIEGLFPRSRTSPAWRLAEAVLEGKKELAMELAREALDSGVELSGGRLVRGDGAVAAMFTVVLARELEKLQLASVMLDEGGRETEVLKELGVPRHREDAFIDRASRTSPELCALGLDCVLDAEVGFKTGRVEPRAALLGAVARIGEILKDVRSGVRQDRRR